MPTYTFKNRATGEVTERFMRMSEREDFLNANPDLEQTITNSSGIVSGVNLKPDPVFREMLSATKKFYRNSTINTY
jgi:hypothetical protein